MKEKLRKFAFDWRFIMLSFGTSLGIMLLIAFCYDMVPFGDITILRMDMYHQYGPLLAELYDRVVHGQSLLYSWTSGGGGSFLGNYANYLASPLSYLILLFGHKNTTECIAFIISLKAALSAGAMTYYLKKSPQFGRSDFLTAGLGILYAFSGYFVAYYWNFMWLDGMVLLPLIILGLEKILTGEKGLFYVISLALLMFASYYMAYMVCIFIILYSIMFIAGTQKASLSTLKNFGRLFGFSLVSGGLAAVSLLPTFYCLKTCSATSDSFPKEFKLYFNAFDFLSQHFAALEPTIRSSGDDVLPNIYCGIATVMLALLFLYIRSIPLREKVAKFVLLLILALSFDINWLNNIWHAFHFPNDLPYRWSYCYSFLLITIAARALFKIKELSGREILNVGIGFALFIITVEKIGSKNVGTDTVIISLVFVIVYTVILYLMRNSRFSAGAMAALVFCVMFAEIAIANTDNYDIDQPKTNYAGDYTDFRKLKSDLDKREKNNFYRMELTSLRARMDDSWYGYNGLSVFSSMAYEKSANLQQNLGMFGNYINSYTYNPQTPVYNAMFSLKYLVNNTPAIDLSDHFYKEIRTVDKFTAYENKYCLPIGFAVPSAVSEWGSGNTDPFINQSNFWEAATGLEGVFEPVPIADCIYYNIDEFPDLSTGNFVFYKTNDDQGASFTLELNPEKEQNLYIFVKSANVKTVTMRNEDSTWLKSQTIDEPYIFDLGVHKAGELLYIDIPIEEGTSGYVDVYTYGLNEDVFKEGFEKLSAGGMTVTKMTDTKVEGKVSAKADTLLFTSINYDKSWTVTVDGKKVPDGDIVSIDGALLGIKLTQGDHTVSLQYRPQGLAAGAAVSAASLAVLLAVSILPKKIKKSAS
ncbi:MAG: YfhO family protein [Clostridia bacterium]|nr:YfhO family protein [Clostridia bacterium]MBQ3897782.1 YfhO family protein [Clostridia bacterium]